MRRIISAVAVLAVLAGCGGGGGDGGGSPEPTFEIPGSLAGEFHNYRVGGTVLSVRGEVEDNQVNGWMQAHDIEGVFILVADVLGPLNADVSAVFIDLDGDVSDTSDAVQAGVLSDASGLEFSEDGTVISLDFTVINLDSSLVPFVNSGELISTTSTLPPKP